ncbi:unnamed protein product [Rodentolepis nana]|uniref:Gag_p30 domain-containing protein n=1 Tax=Rodentolepis nana TaxID=102285 RepID=A0A0R3T7B5_RODNA|nr:unnamed protein product [Rodentolepis nana]
MIDPSITQEEWEAAEREADRGPVLNFLQNAMDRLKKAGPTPLPPAIPNTALRAQPLYFRILDSRVCVSAIAVVLFSPP